MKAFAIAVLLLGCAHDGSVARYASARTEELRAQFPPGKATRAEVTARAGDQPQFSLARPSLGWQQEFIRDVEDRSGLIVARAEKYISPMATSAGLTLAHVWYFYDRFDVLVDVEWERMGD